MGTWCGQVGASVAAQAFQGVVKIWPCRAVPTKVGTHQAGYPWFSTPRVESDGGLVWTSGCEPRTASASMHDDFLSRSTPAQRQQQQHPQQRSTKQAGERDMEIRSAVGDVPGDS